MTRYKGRFAPSPTGYLHFGSLIAAVGSYLDAKAHYGQWIVRMEDVDEIRSKKEYDQGILETLEAYGFQWDGPIIRQSQRKKAYQAAFEELKAYIYPCSCSRKELVDFPLASDGAVIYPGTCLKGLHGKAPRVWRLKVPDQVFQFTDRLMGNRCQNLLKEVGDFVLLRVEGYFAYQLAVVVDDAYQNITHVVRGMDLIDSTPRQIYLQQLLGYPSLTYLHLPLVLDEKGQKLSKHTHASPIDNQNPIPSLLKAFEFLGLSRISGDTLDDLWKEAILSWQDLIKAKEFKIVSKEDPS